jgi:hypothetical protein
MAISSILRLYGKFCSYLVFLWLPIWAILCIRFGMLYREKSGNPGWKCAESVSAESPLRVFHLANHNLALTYSTFQSDDALRQGDLKRLRKIAQNVAQPNFCQNY